MRVPGFCHPHALSERTPPPECPAPSRGRCGAPQDFPKGTHGTLGQSEISAQHSHDVRYSALTVGSPAQSTGRFCEGEGSTMCREGHAKLQLSSLRH